MKKVFVSLFTIIIVIFSLTFVPGIFDDTKNGIIVLENESLKNPSNITFDENDPEYVLNLNTKKYHKKNCVYASNISEGSYFKTSDIDYITSRGYTKCSICFKDD